MNGKRNANTTPKSGNLGRRLAKHFAALAIPAILIPAAQAQIVWSGPVNINVPSNIDGVYLNVLTGATGSAGFAGWDINPYTTGSGAIELSFWSPDITSHGIVNSLGDGVAFDNLVPGTLINGSLGYSRGAIGVETTGPTAFQLNSSANLVGFRFLNEGSGQVHFGWLRMSLSDTVGNQPRSITDYAYESTAGLAIGAGVIPEPASASLLLLGLGGLVGLRGWSRRQ